MSVQEGITTESDVQSFAKHMAEQHDEEHPQLFLLFLGAECARAANVPTIEKLAHQLFDILYRRNPQMATAWLPERDQEDPDNLQKAFFELLGDMSNNQRHSLMQTLYSNLPVPLFYQDIAALIRAEYFRNVLTTNFDTLLEQALSGVGLRQGTDFVVISSGNTSDRKAGPYFSELSDNQVRVIKLHDELGQKRGEISPEEIEAVLGPRRRFGRGKPKYDVVMVGYEFEYESLVRWLAKAPGSRLWWVSTERPSPQQVQPIEKVRRVTYINGPNANIESFFGKLALSLLRMPISEPLPRSFEENINAVLAISLRDAAKPTGSTLSDEYLEYQYLRSQLRHCRQVLYNLEQSAIPGDKNMALQAQIEYQKRQITRFEDRFRALSVNRPHVIKLMEQITECAQHASIDLKTMLYLENLTSTVKEEYQGTEPNQNIVSGSIRATVAVAERLGSEVVNPNLVSELASLAHGSMAWRM